MRCDRWAIGAMAPHAGLARGLVLSVLALGVAVWTPARAADPPPANVVQLSAQAVVEVPQDWLQINLAATVDGSDSASVQARLRQTVDAALRDARQAARPGQIEVRSGQFNLQPRFGNEGRIVSWVGRADLILEGRDTMAIAELAGRIRGLNVAQVAFGLSREARQKAQADAQLQAVERFKSDAQALTKAFGFGAYTLREVQVLGGEQGPVLMMARAQTPGIAGASQAAPVPVEAGRSQVTATVSGSIQLR